MSGDVIVRLLAIERLMNEWQRRLLSLEQGQAQNLQAIGQLGQRQEQPGGGGTIQPATSTSIIAASSTGTATLPDTSTITVNNNYTAAVASGKKIMVGQDPTGAWWLLGADCP